MTECVTHHLACDCREARFKRMEEALKRAYKEMSTDYVQEAWGRDLSYIEELFPDGELQTKTPPVS